MLERERTFLIKNLPPDIEEYPSKDIFDIYLPADNPHPALRIRKHGDDRFEITRKTQAASGDASALHEHNIKITKEEHATLATLPGKRLRKTRYYYPHAGRTIEIDVFKGDLSGLALADIELGENEGVDITSVPTPEFCLADITQEECIAGGLLCGKSYADIEPLLEKFGYQKITPPKRRQSNLVPYRRRDGTVEVFLQKREMHRARLPGFFGFWGGGANAGESAEQTLLREIREEMGYTPITHAFFKTYDFPKSIKHVYLMEAPNTFEKEITVLEGECGTWFSAKKMEHEEKLIEEDKTVLRDVFASLKSETGG